MYYDKYFIFVTIFLFLNPHQIVSLILSMRKVKSNIVITASQIENFLEVFDEDILSSVDLYTFKSECCLHLESCREAPYGLREFINYICSLETFMNYFKVIKVRLVAKIMPMRIYKSIINRMNFYLCINCEKPPQEKCTTKLYRLIFKFEPEPYHYDYSLPNPSADSIENLVLTLKHTYGYAGRKSSVLLSKPQTSQSYNSYARSPSLVHIHNSVYLETSVIKKSVRNSIKSAKIVPIK